MIYNNLIPSYICDMIYFVSLALQVYVIVIFDDAASIFYC